MMSLFILTTCCQIIFKYENCHSPPHDDPCLEQGMRFPISADAQQLLGFHGKFSQRYRPVQHPLHHQGRRGYSTFLRGRDALSQKELFLHLG